MIDTLTFSIIFRHEVPVSNEKIKIIHIDEDLVVVNKPASIVKKCYVVGYGPSKKPIFNKKIQLGDWKQRWLHLQILETKKCKKGYGETTASQWDKSICAKCKGKVCVSKKDAINKVCKHFIINNKTENLSV